MKKQNKIPFIGKNKLLVQLALVGSLALSLQASFTKSGDVVTDSISGLQWVDKNGQSDNGGYTFLEAITNCEDSTIGGYSDWRLPNIYELQSIVDITKPSAPSIYSTFLYTASSFYWSSTTLIPDTTVAYMINFNSGFITGGLKINRSYIRCVRGGQ